MMDAKRMLEMNTNREDRDRGEHEEKRVEKNVKMSEDNRMMNMLVNKTKEMETEYDTSEHLVIDFGSAITKIGISWEDLPRVVIPSIFAESRVDSDKKNDYLELKSRLFGYEALDPKIRDAYNIKFLKPGHFKGNTDIEFFEFLKEILDTKLSHINPSDNKVIMNVSIMKNFEDVIKLGKMLLEDLNFKAFALMNHASLSLYSTGRTSGVVVECGEIRSFVVPIYEGWPLLHYYNKNKIGGRDLTQVFADGVLENGIDISPSDLKNLRIIKEKTCSVPHLKDFEYYMNYDEDIIAPEKMLYKLPDKNEIVNIPKATRLIASELLFTPSILGKSDKGLVPLIADSIKKSSIDSEEMKRLMINNIVLSGGTTMMPGFAQRIKKTLFNYLDTDYTYNTTPQIIAENNRNISTWVGASMIASMSSFEKMFIKKDEFNEHGEDRIPLFSKIL